MTPGDLVKITRASIGIPKNTIALVLDFTPAAHVNHVDVWHVQLMSGQRRGYLKQDLEIINADR